MSQHEVEVKPYGTKNMGGTQSFPLPEKVTTTVEVKPPYGQRNVDEIRPAGGIGSRSDVEVKPYGTSDQNLPRDSILKPRGNARPLDLSQFKNPMMAAALGITLALLLWSLSQLPRMISGVWHGRQPETWQQKASAEYNARQRDASFKGGEMYQAGKDTLESAKDRASEMYSNAKESVESTGQHIYNKARDAVAGGSGDSFYASSSITDEARRAACRTAERARDIACQTGDFAPDAGSSIQNKASEIYEAAKARAAAMLEAAKNTVTYPVNAAADSLSQTTESAKDSASSTFQAAKDTVTHTGDNVRDAASSTFQAARDTVAGAAGTMKGAAESAKEAVKDTVVGAGEAIKHAATGVKDTVVGAGHAVRDTLTPQEREVLTREQRGPTKIKVEVQEL
jgi:hypothetical protein